jgi:hypothetical protein
MRSYKQKKFFSDEHGLEQCAAASCKKDLDASTTDGRMKVNED